MSPVIVILQKSQEMLDRMGRDLSESDLVLAQDYVLTGAEDEAARFTAKDKMQMLVVGTTDADRSFADRMRARNDKLVVMSFGLLSMDGQPKAPFNGFITHAHKLKNFKNSLVRVMEEFIRQSRRLSHV